LLCACLPNEQDIPLPFYINADFFPSNDRKHVLLADDYQSEWNREALRAAAQAVANGLSGLTNFLGPKHFWEFLRTLKDTADLADRGGAEPTLSQFWKTLEPRLKASSIIYTNNGKWTTPSEAYFPLQKEEASATPVLEGLGLNSVHEDLRPHQTCLYPNLSGFPSLTSQPSDVLQRLKTGKAPPRTADRTASSNGEAKHPIDKPVLRSHITLSHPPNAYCPNTNGFEA
jgi:hypothetical protein